MLSAIRRHLNPGTLIAFVALIFAVTGGAFAASGSSGGGTGGKGTARFARTTTLATTAKSKAKPKAKTGPGGPPVLPVKPARPAPPDRRGRRAPRDQQVLAAPRGRRAPQERRAQRAPPVLRARTAPPASPKSCRQARRRWGRGRSQVRPQSNHRVQLRADGDLLRHPACGRTNGAYPAPGAAETRRMPGDRGKPESRGRATVCVHPGR